MVDLEQAYPTDRIKLYPCDICGRNFNQDSLGKHRNVCRTSTKSKRKVFDSGRQRADGSDVIYSKTKETKKIQILGEVPEQDKPHSNWREQHKEFLRTVRNARNVSEAIKTGAPLPKFEPSAVPSDYVNCQYCGRNFSRNAAERHIPFCETQHKRQKMNTSANQKTTMGKTRAPLPGNQRKQSSEAYGYSNENSNSSFSAQQRTSGYAYNNHPNNKGYSSGGAGAGSERKPIRYDAHQYYDSDGQDAGGYSSKSKNQAMINKNRQQEMLRTGRNTLNSELNALARNRTGGNNSQKESPINSRDPSVNRRQVVQQNGVRGGNPRAQPHTHNNVESSRFCHECGYEFPVQWARFCSYCGDKRL